MKLLLCYHFFTSNVFKILAWKDMLFIDRLSCVGYSQILLKTFSWTVKWTKVTMLFLYHNSCKTENFGVGPFWVPFFFKYYLAVPRPTLGHFWGDSLPNPMLITAFLLIRPEGHREPRNEVGSLSPAERVVGFEPGSSDSNFNALTH